MTSEIFESILSTWNQHLRAKSRFVLLLVDNAACHPREFQGKFSQIKIVYMPPNTTSELQPLDLGIIQNLKTKYRTFFLRYVLAKIEDCTNVTEVANSIDVLTAIRWISKAWDEVKQETVIKCFRKAGILDKDQSLLSCEPCSDDDWDPFADVDAQLHDLVVQAVPSDDCCTAKEYLSSENNMQTCPNYDNDETWDRDFMTSIKASISGNEGDSDSNDDEEEVEAPPPKLKNLRDVISSLEDVKHFMEVHGFGRESAQVHSIIDNLAFAKVPGKQSDI